jgi:hypothetical protein
MFVTKHPNRYLINMSHGEMDALRRVVNAGILLLEGEDGEGLWSSFSVPERMIVGRWQRRDPLELTGPRRQQVEIRRRRKRKAKLSEGLSSVA